MINTGKDFSNAILSDKFKRVIQCSIFMKKLLTSIIIISTIIFGSFSNSGIIASNLPSTNSSQLITDSINRSSWWWTETEVISTESTGNSYSLEMATDSEDNIHVVWYDQTDYLGCGIDNDIFYKKWDTVTKTWSTAEVVSTESTGSSNIPSLTIDSEDNIHVVWHDQTDYLGSGGTDYDIFYKIWDANTELWGTTEVVSIESTDISYDATIVVDSSGDIYVAWEDETNDDAEVDRDIYFKKKDFGTSTWGTAEDLSIVSDSGSFDPCLGIDSSGDVHIAWIDNADYDPDPDSDVFYRYLDSATDSWSVTEVLSTVGVALSEYVSLAVDSEDNIHVAWSDSADYSGSGAGEHDVFYKYKLATTGTWSATELATSQSYQSSRDTHVVVDSLGYVHIAFRDGSDIFEAGSDYDILYNYRDPLTDSWSSIQVICSISTMNSWKPSVIADKKGQIHVAWYDSTDYDGAGADYDVFYKKFVGPSQAPLLFPIIPNLSTSGIVNIDWSEVAGCDYYYLYREVTPISTLTGLSTHNKTTDSFSIDAISENGTYYYVVVSENDYGNSTFSNIESVQVDFADNGTDLFSFISNELLIVAGILLVTQIIFFILSIRIRKKK